MRLEGRFVCSWSLAGSSYGLLYMIELDVMYIMYLSVNHIISTPVSYARISLYIPRVNLG